MFHHINDHNSREQIAELLTPAELETLNTRMAMNADKWLGEQAMKNKEKSKASEPEAIRSARGRKPNVVVNPFYSIVGCATHWGRYPAFALDIIEGVARLDWHDRPIGVGGKSMPLSVRNLAVILESLPLITGAAVRELLELDERHARRYVKAIEMIVPRMMVSRPDSLRDEMEGIEPEPKTCQWFADDDLPPPSPEALAKLHYDLRTLTTYRSAEEYEADELSNVQASNVIVFPARKQHPKRHEALRLLEQGTSIRATARELGISVNSVMKWRDEELLAA